MVFWHFIVRPIDTNTDFLEKNKSIYLQDCQDYTHFNSVLQNGECNTSSF